MLERKRNYKRESYKTWRRRIWHLYDWYFLCHFTSIFFLRFQQNHICKWRNCLRKSSHLDTIPPIPHTHTNRHVQDWHHNKCTRIGNSNTNHIDFSPRVDVVWLQLLKSRCKLTTKLHIISWSVVCIIIHCK